MNSMDELQIYALGAVAWGLLATFWGYRILRLAVALLGFLLGGYWAWHLSGNWTLVAWQTWAITGAGALLGLLLLWPIYQLGVCLLGAYAGWMLGLAALRHLALPWPDWAALVPAALLGACALLLLRPLLIILTATAGAWAVTTWCAFLLGWAPPVAWTLQSRELIENPPEPAVALLVAWLVISGLGILVQSQAAQRGTGSTAQPPSTAG